MLPGARRSRRACLHSDASIERRAHDAAFKRRGERNKVKAAPVDGARGRDAGERGAEFLHQLVEQGLRNYRQAIQRPTAGAQEHELDGNAKPPVGPEARSDFLCIVGEQAEEPGDIKLGQGRGKPIGADETQVVGGWGSLAVLAPCQTSQRRRTGILRLPAGLRNRSVTNCLKTEIIPV